MANYLPAVIEASQDGVPLVVVTADRPPELIDAGANQAIRQPGIFGDYLRWSFTLPAPDAGISGRLVLSTVDQALHRALGPPAGPVHINCMFREPLEPVGEEPWPDDIPLRWRKGSGPLTVYARPETAPDAGSLERIAATVAASRRGLVVIGNLPKERDREAAAALADAPRLARGGGHPLGPAPRPGPRRPRPLPRPAPLAQIAARLAPDAGDLRYFGGLSFDGRTAADRDWAPFGAARFTLPRFEITREGETWSLACTIAADPDAPPRQTLRRLEEELSHLRTGQKATAPLPPLLAPHGQPGPGGLGPGRSRRCCAGSSTARCKRWFSRAARISGSPRPRTPSCCCTACARQTRRAFTSPSSPRRARPSRRLPGAALPPRRPPHPLRGGGRHPRRGDSEHEDQAMGDALLESEKDRREHRFVADEVGRKLDGLCRSYRADREVSLLKLARLQHLRRGFEGTLRTGVDDAAIVAALHPTPAVAGNPTAAAVAEISRREPFHRGWYAGPLGWVGAGGADFTVAIRSGLLSGDRLALFTGAGIVRGSMPHAEWEELENKLAGFVRVIGAP